LYANCPSANVYHEYVAQGLLTGLPIGAFSTVVFDLNPDIVAIMNASHSDLSLSISINNSPAAESYVLDNLRFVP
jgi:hypothetical protein